jgi:hypothetical protein
LRDQRGIEFDLLEKALEASIVGVDLRTARKGRGNLGEIDGFDFEHTRDEGGEAFNAGEMPVGKVEFEDLGEHGRMIHGVLS